MANVDALKVTRATTKGSITRIKTHIEKNDDTITMPELECRLSLLEAYFKQILSIQDSVDLLLPDNEQEIKKRGELEELYITVKTKILSLMAERKTAQLVTVPSDESHNQTFFLQSPKSSNLVKLKLPKFSGQYTDYPNFIQQFTSRVDNDTTMSTIDKFTHLEDCLVGDAKLVIKSLDIVGSNYRKALEMLKDRYDNKCIIIQSHVRKIFELQNVTRNSASQLRNLVDSIDGHIRALYSLGDDIDIFHAFLLHIVVSKLDNESLSKWEDSLNLIKLPTWEECSTFLSKRCQHLENREIVNKSSYQQQQSLNRTNKGSNWNQKITLTASLQQCSYCKQNNHSIQKCKKFLELSVINRYFEAKKLFLCLNCLLVGHSAKQCHSSKCKVCNGLHNTLLHRFSNISSSAQADVSSQPKVNNSVASEPGSNQNVLHSSLNVENSSTTDSCVLLATAVINVKDNVGSFVPIRVLLDSASQLNFITQYAAQKLGLKRKKISEIINGIGAISSKIRHKTSTMIKSTITDFETNIDLWILPSITTPQPEVKLDIENWHIPNDVALADSQFSEPQRIDMLIGAELFFDLLLEDKIKLGLGMPTLINTVFGWIVSGNYTPTASQQMLSSLVSIKSDEDGHDVLNENLQKFWKMEEVQQIENHVSDEQTKCEQLFVETVTQTSDGRLMVKLPFKHDPSDLGDSFKMAERRFKNLEYRLMKHKDLKSQYVDFMREYEVLGHMVAIPEEKISSICYIMPHQCVIRPDSSTTKLRVVFDASARTSSNLSLNDVLMVGPTVQDDLFSIILRFRSYTFALTADISKMYRQFLVYPDDRYYQCILWRENSDDKLKAYKLNTLTYGTAPAPYLATRCLNYLADKYMTKYPIGAKIIKRDFYVDDLISGANTRAEMVEIRNQIESIFKHANLELRKWFSNDEKFINNIPENEREKPLRINDLEIIKALGIVWEPVLDEFRFVNSIQESDQNITKRSVLSDLSRLFDPLGLVSPVIVLAKIFMQSLWILKLDWDTSIPNELANQWRTYRSQLHNLNKVHIPRCIFSSKIVKCDLHGFADASLRAYGCCLYTRCEDSSGNVVIRLLGAKSKVAPVSTESLPKLELNAALVLAKLLDRVTTSLDKSFDNIYLWTDSEIVLDWLADHPSAWETYIANRVSTIQKLTLNASWRHVNSKSNPADIVSRGSLADELLQSIWFTGPDFLYQTENFWPRNKERKSKENVPGKRKIKSILTITVDKQKISDEVLKHKFVNNFAKIRRTFAYCIRFFKNVQAKSNKTEVVLGPLSTRELDDAFLRMVWHVQRQHFKDDITILEKSNQFIDKERNVNLHKHSSIKALNPFLDTTSKLKLLKVGGRLRNSDLPDMTKYPILIPKNHPLSFSYINYLHISNFHAGSQSLVSIARQRFWIIDVKHITRKVVHSCIRCFKARPKLLEQIMGDLPPNRVRPARPFWNCGVDFCGPINTTQRIRSRGPIKSYVAVFVCFVTKAVHLEVVSTLSSDGFIAALKRFIARRGICRNLYCDNATNFVGARNELADCCKVFHAKETTEKILNSCSEMSIEFHHIPPRSPHFGGLWEAAVKSAKHLLIRTIGDSILTFEELTTAIAQIEAILNSRPITAMSSDPNDDTALTPGHFLVGSPLNALAEPDVTQQKSTLLHRWQLVRSLQQTFWNRWRSEYVTQLQHRYKWNSSSTDVKEGTLVIIHEDNVPPQRWLLGRIIETIGGKDGHIRVVNIKTKNGVVKRSINKIAPLPVENC